MSRTNSTKGLGRLLGGDQYWFYISVYINWYQRLDILSASQGKEM
jgi:hypothetical protein